MYVEKFLQQVHRKLNEQGNKDSCFPAISTICRETKLSRSTVKRAIGDLEKAGFIDKERRYRQDGSNSSNLYILGE